MGDTWHPVSGGIEPGETATAAAVRELFEESGLRPERLWNVNTVNAFYVAQYDRVFFTIAFVAEVTSDVPVTLSVEHTAARWVAADALPTELFWPGQQQHAHEILTHILAPSRIEPHLRIAAF